MSKIPAEVDVMIVGLLSALIFGFSTKLSSLSTRLGTGLSVGIAFMMTIRPNNRILPAILHYVLRVMLSQHRLLPWRLVRFLDYATDLIFLRRVGGSYIVVHRLLMEYFAEMEV